MKYLNNDRAPRVAQELLDQIRATASRPWRLLEGLGGQAHQLSRRGGDRGLPAGVEFVHGPGCPACALPVEVIDQAVALAESPGVVFCTPGGLLRVPGGGVGRTLEAARARGADVRAVYSALDALSIARKSPDRTVVFLASGFETTAPTSAAAVLEAERLGLEHFVILNGHLRASAGLAASVRMTNARGALAPGVVASVTGLGEFESLRALEGVPVVITGPEPLDFLEGTLMAVRQLEEGRASVENQYARAVRPGGATAAKAAIAEVFESADAEWRGLGRVAGGGLALRERFRPFDAVARFGPGPTRPVEEPNGCHCGAVVAGLARPDDCPSFGGRCSPDRPLGAPMASVEGTCLAYHRRRRPAPTPLSPVPTALASRPSGA